ncbi:MAG TPA: hypothetical protein VJP88_02110 [Caulobacteraceae bacterium]|nr:hypothetical protein [Caulobacteraceae bacterium]
MSALTDIVPTCAVRDWPADNIARFGKDIVTFRHALADLPLFSDEGLADVLDRYPREALGVFTMGEDLENWRSWRRGSAGAISGADLLAAVREGRLWLNLRHANLHLPEFAVLCAAISAEKERHLKTPVLNRDLGLLISSPGARVFYHLDVPLSSLWQIRGQKRIWFYPRSDTYVDPAWLEACVHGDAEGQMPFRTEWDDDAVTLALNPGDMVTWPQNMSHRVDNGPMMNVSVSMEFMTPQARARGNVLYANGVLRRSLGWTPAIQDRGPAFAAKLAFASLHKALRRRERKPVLPESFVVEARAM